MAECGVCKFRGAVLQPYCGTCFPEVSRVFELGVRTACIYEESLAGAFDRFLRLLDG
jgi:hypothetical protein